MKLRLDHWSTSVFAVSLACLVQVLLCPGARAQEPSRQNIAPEAPRKGISATEAATLFPFHPIGSWQGQRFIFLPCPKPLEHATYDDFSGTRKRKDYRGRIAKVVSVTDFSGRAHLEFADPTGFCG
ncbi:MAG: hypothetical protein HYR56_22320 [Acidobacteria bacterium]|nr:hypothetical protein [Acidobacteriota bacterium]MBI3426629.1 hypothetical protein [Acidobacteriota bacterium]